MLMFVLLLLIVIVSDVAALQEDVRKLMVLIQKLIAEFRAMKLEVETSNIDIMESIQLMMTVLIAEHTATM